MKSLIALRLFIVFGLSLALFACAKTPNPEPQKQLEAPLASLSIGYQKAALKLIVAKKNHFFEQEFANAKVAWKEFPAGPQTLEALSVGAIDFGYTGDAPIIFALAAGKGLQYLASESSSKQAHALLVPPESTIKNIAELKGKRIAVTKGSSAHNFLAETLKKANLTWDDIQPIWLSPADARAALDKKAVDAWAIWEPYISATELNGSANNIFDSTELPDTYAFYSAQPKFIQQHPESAAKVIQVLNKTDQWIDAHPQETAQILAESTGIDLAVAEKVISKKPKPSTVQILTSEVLTSQQHIADLFYQLKLIPIQVTVSTAAWDGKN